MRYLLRALHVFLATLREIFDEAAYERFLRRANVASSRAAYSDFCRERESDRGRRPRCC